MSSIDQHVGKKIRERRTALLMSSRDVAQKLGVSERHIDGLEDGSIRAFAEELLILCQLLEIKPAVLYEGFVPLGPGDSSTSSHEPG